MNLLTVLIYCNWIVWEPSWRYD